MEEEAAVEGGDGGSGREQGAARQGPDPVWGPTSPGYWQAEVFGDPLIKELPSLGDYCLVLKALTSDATSPVARQV